MMKTEFTIRPMVPSNAGRLKEIIDLSFSGFMGFFAFHSVREMQHVLVSETAETVAGFVKPIDVQVGSGRYGCILWVAVHPQFRRKGIAAALVNAGIEYLKHAGAKAVFASVQRRNTASLTLFYKQGFRKKSFLELWRLFSWRTFQFYREIWLAPGEIVLMHE
jgi:ribosomal protein S18 acetylase RimI-like enzyme